MDYGLILAQYSNHIRQKVFTNEIIFMNTVLVHYSDHCSTVLFTCFNIKLVCWKTQKRLNIEGRLFCLIKRQTWVAEQRRTFVRVRIWGNVVQWSVRRRRPQRRCRHLFASSSLDLFGPRLCWTPRCSGSRNRRTGWWTSYKGLKIK